MITKFIFIIGYGALCYVVGYFYGSKRGFSSAVDLCIKQEKRKWKQ